MVMYLSSVDLMSFLWDAILDSTWQLRAIREFTGTLVLLPKTLYVELFFLPLHFYAKV